jgi:diaminopimelate epimerase
VTGAARHRPARFAKLHGAGNDFLVFDGRTGPHLAAWLPAATTRLCHRRLGVGADGVLLVSPDSEGVARLVYWNADGSEAAFCANGTRCAARFVAERWGWTAPVLLTPFAAIAARVKGAEVTLDLPAPAEVAEWRTFAVRSGEVRARFMVVGVPHLVVPVAWDDFWVRPLEPLAPELRSHPGLGAAGANVSFVAVAEGGLAVRSWERGVEGETLSCGSGDVAVALTALAEGWTTPPARVRTASGRVLEVEAAGEPPQCPARLTGPAEWVCDGELREELTATGR